MIILTLADMNIAMGGFSRNNVRLFWIEFSMIAVWRKLEYVIKTPEILVLGSAE